jgi:hypothetical protein
MSDKEFDKLFQQKFEALEVEPSGAVWKGIEIEVRQKGKPKRDKYILWGAAASILLVIASAIWFAPQKEKIWLQQEKLVIADSSGPERSPVLPDKSKEERKMTADAREPVQVAVDVEQPQQLATKKPPAEQARSLNPAEVAEVPQPTVEEIPNADAIGALNAIASTVVKMDDELPKESLVIAAATEDAPDERGRKGRDVKSIGDLVNFVVGKVDKRQDKLIQFKDNDEGSFITGLNLGIVKIRSRNQ